MSECRSVSEPTTLGGATRKLLTPCRSVTSEHLAEGELFDIGMRRTLCRLTKIEGCFLSDTLPALLAARVTMGIGGGAFLVRAMTALNRLHTIYHSSEPRSG